MATHWLEGCWIALLVYQPGTRSYAAGLFALALAGTGGGPPTASAAFTTAAGVAPAFTDARFTTCALKTAGSAYVFYRTGAYQSQPESLIVALAPGTGGAAPITVLAGGGSLTGDVEAVWATYPGAAGACPQSPIAPTVAPRRKR